MPDHLMASKETIRVLVEESERIMRERGTEAGYQMLGNALEDVITLFEGFLKRIYVRYVREKFNDAAERMVGKVGTTFQRLEGAEEIFRRDLGIEIFSEISSTERDNLSLQFARRHVLTHNLGMVDKKYQGQVQRWEMEGTDVPLQRDQILQSMDLVVRVVGGVITHLGHESETA